MNEVSKYLQNETATIEGKTKEKSIQYFSGKFITKLLDKNSCGAKIIFFFCLLSWCKISHLFEFILN